MLFFSVGGADWNSTAEGQTRNFLWHLMGELSDWNFGWIFLQDAAVVAAAVVVVGGIRFSASGSGHTRQRCRMMAVACLSDGIDFAIKVATQHLLLLLLKQQFLLVLLVLLLLLLGKLVGRLSRRQPWGCLLRRRRHTTETGGTQLLRVLVLRNRM